MMRYAAPLPARPRFSRSQTDALEAVGVALAGKALSWDEAVTLRDRVRAGEITEVLSVLAVARGG